jgi:hypothetical protein
LDDEHAGGSGVGTGVGLGVGRGVGFGVGAGVGWHFGSLQLEHAQYLSADTQ